MATNRATQAPSDSATGNQGAVSRMAAEECHLLNLPVELQKTILEYLTTNRDKKSACLTCKQMQLLATPLLYRHMEVSSQCLDTRFKESISKRHPGLKHIRTLRILALRDTFTIGPHIAGKGAASAIRRLFATIPEHSLTHFELPMFGFCETSIENTIRIKQRRVANYQYRQNGPECWRNLSFRADDFVCITKLQIEMTTLEHQEHAIVLLDSTPNLANLDLINSYDDLADSVGVPVPRTPLARGPRRLKTLRLEKFDFANGSTEIARLVKLDELEDLQLIDCDGYPVLLRDRKILPLSLRALRWSSTTKK